MVPLEVADRVLAQQRVEPLQDVRVRVGVGQVQHLLVARRQRRPAVRPQDPVGVRPREVGVEVDHLGLDPQAELHPEPADRLDERVQAVGPHALVDVPVAQPRGVVAAVAEPAVVEDVALHPGLRTEPGQLGQAREVVVEVHRLPRVHHDRARAARVLRARPQVGVEAGRDRVEAGPVRAVHPWRRVALAAAEHDLAGEQQLTPAQHGRSAGQPLGVGDVVAAPRHVHGPDLAATRVEPGRARRENERGVRAGAPAAVLPRMHADDEGQPLRRALAAPAAREVEQLRRDRRNRQRQAQALQPVPRRRGGDRRTLPHETGRQQLDLDPDGEARDVVGSGGDHAVGGGVESGQGEPGRPVLPRPRPGESRPPVPARGVLGQQGDRAGGVVEIVLHRARHRGDRERSEVR